MTTATFHAEFDSARAEVTEKVRKLLAKAEDLGTTPHEADAFTAKAQELMSRYSISLSMVSDLKRPDELVSRKIRMEGTYGRRKTHLAFAVLRANDCRGVWMRQYLKAPDGSYIRTPTGYKSGYFLDIVGYAEDVMWVETLYRSLEHQLDHALAAENAKRSNFEHGRTWAVAFVEGFTEAVAQRLKAAKDEAIRREQERADTGHRVRLQAALEESGPTEQAASPMPVSLVLLAKNERVDADYKVRHPGTRTTYLNGGRSAAGRAAGSAAGRRASLARGAVSGRPSLNA